MNCRLLALAAVVVACGQAHAAGPTMPIDFVGDWCFVDEDKNVASYVLPSWTDDGRCTKIISINKSGFYFKDASQDCETVKLRVAKDAAPSGSGYTATITARCRPDGAATAGKLQTFEFYRYKGNLSVTPK